MNSEHRNKLFRLTLLLFLLSSMVPVAGWLWYSARLNWEFSFRIIADIHRRSPEMYLLWLLPIILAGATFYFTSGYYRLKEKKQSEQKQHFDNLKLVLGKVKKISSGALDLDTHIEHSVEATTVLEELKNYLLQQREQDQSGKAEDDRRNWVSEGLAKFAELLRATADSLEDFAFDLIKNLVQYIGANQGGFFLLRENKDKERDFDLLACYAYNRRKFADKTVAWGDGMIGAAAIEKGPIYLTDVPDGYLEITSGLGHSTPSTLIIVPMIYQDSVIGILEIGSFREYASFELDFLKRVAESIATTIASIQNSLKTEALLKASRKQAETLAQQEEQLRQQMEELRSTQEQAASQAERFISFTNSVNHTLIRADYDVEGNLLYANTLFLKKLGYTGNAEVEGKPVSMFINEKDLEWFNEIWNRLAEGGRHFEGYMKLLTKQGQDLWTMATYTCIRNDNGSVDRILFLAIDNTEQKKQSLDFEGQIEAINRINLKAEFTPDGKVIKVNELFEKTMKYTAVELPDMNVFDFLGKKDLEHFSEVWEHVLKGEAFQGQVKMLTRYEEEKWFRATFTAVNDMYGEVTKVIFLASEITGTKNVEAESRRLSEQLKLREERLELAELEMNKKLEEKEKNIRQQTAALQKENRHYRSILSSLPIAVTCIDNQSMIRYMNRAALDLWKTSMDKALDQPLKSLFPGKEGDYPARFEALLDTEKEKTAFKDQEIEFRTGRKRHKLKVTLEVMRLTEGKEYLLFMEEIIK